MGPTRSMLLSYVVGRTMTLPPSSGPRTIPGSPPPGPVPPAPPPRTAARPCARRTARRGGAAGSRGSPPPGTGASSGLRQLLAVVVLGVADDRVDVAGAALRGVLDHHGR